VTVAKVMVMEAELHSTGIVTESVTGSEFPSTYVSISNVREYSVFKVLSFTTVQGYTHEASKAA